METIVSGAVMGQTGHKAPGEAGRACWGSPWGLCWEFGLHPTDSGKPCQVQAVRGGEGRLM